MGMSNGPHLARTWLMKRYHRLNVLCSFGYTPSGLAANGPDQLRDPRAVGTGVGDGGPADGPHVDP